VPVEQRARHWRDDQAREEAEESGGPGELRGVIAGKHEQDERHRDHRPRNATEQQAGIQAREAGDAQQSAIS